MDNDSCTGWTFFEDQGEKRWVFRSFSTICRHWCLSSASWTGNKCSTFLFSSFFDPSYFFLLLGWSCSYFSLSVSGWFQGKIWNAFFFSFLNINQAPFNLNVKWIWLSRLGGVLPLLHLCSAQNLSQRDHFFTIKLPILTPLISIETYFRGKVCNKVFEFQSSFSLLFQKLDSIWKEPDFTFWMMNMEVCGPFEIKKGILCFSLDFL